MMEGARRHVQRRAWPSSKGQHVQMCIELVGNLLRIARTSPSAAVSARCALCRRVGRQRQRLAGVDRVQAAQAGEQAHKGTRCIDSQLRQQHRRGLGC